ncbi:MAG: hypothetical protein LC789_09805 [Actinobacteria bacterium]|nr:hypothetical protein [Actinomycetota bacterium]
MSSEPWSSRHNATSFASTSATVGTSWSVTSTATHEGAVEEPGARGRDDAPVDERRRVDQLDAPAPARGRHLEAPARAHEPQQVATACSPEARAGVDETDEEERSNGDRVALARQQQDREQQDEPEHAAECRREHRGDEHRRLDPTQARFGGVDPGEEGAAGDAAGDVADQRAHDAGDQDGSVAVAGCEQLGEGRPQAVAGGGEEQDDREPDEFDDDRGSASLLWHLSPSTAGRTAPRRA